METAVMCFWERAPGRALTAGTVREPSRVTTRQPARARPAVPRQVVPEPLRPDVPHDAEEAEFDAVARAIGEGGNIG
jgi:hypothetical protein